MSRKLKQPLTHSLTTVGWREWVSLPELNLPGIKAKVDTGAKTSALHAFKIEPFTRDQQDFVRFFIHPIQKNNDLVIQCESKIIDQRHVTDSGGHQELRYVIKTNLQLGNHQWAIDMTLTNRDNMRFRMLLGRRAMKNRLIVDSAKSYLSGKPDIATLYTSHQTTSTL